MIAPGDLYIMDVASFTKDLYRMGNATWPAFTEDRARSDVAILKQDGIETVIANGNGFSAFDHLTKIMKKPGKKQVGWVELAKPNTVRTRDKKNVGRCWIDTNANQFSP